MPDKFNTDYFKFFRLAFVGFLAYLISTLLAPIVTVSPYVLCLLFGIIATSIGFLERQVLQKANGFGLAMHGTYAVRFRRFEKSDTFHDDGNSVST